MPERKTKAPVSGQLVPAEGLNLVFGSGGRKSGYDDLLNQLLEAGPGTLLRFDNTRCRATVFVRAKKLGMRVLCAEKGSDLYVQLVRVKPAPAVDGTPTLRDAVRTVVREAPRTAAEVFDHVRQLLPEAVRGSVDATLAQLRDRNEVAKRDDLKWYPIPHKGAK